MARVGRLAGALLAQTGGEYYLVGNPKVPLDFARAGFEPPPLPIDARERPYIRLQPCRHVDLEAPVLALDVEGEVLARLLVALFVIERTGSISERLWRLVVGEDEERHLVEARWLGELPAEIWHIVRDTVLRCS